MDGERAVQRASMYMAFEMVLWMVGAMPNLAMFMLLPAMGSFAYGEPLAGIVFAIVLVPIALGVFWLAILVAGTIVELFWKIGARPGTAIPESAKRQIVESPDCPQFLKKLINEDRIVLVASDFSVGAQVRGVAVSQIVISSGLLFLLLRGDKRGYFVVAHEYAHIVNGDKLVPGLIAIVLGGIAFVIADSLYLIPSDYYRDHPHLGQVVLNAVALLFVLTVTVHRREYYADYAGVVLAGTGKGLSGIVRDAGWQEWSLTHPGSQDRSLILSTDSRHNPVHRNGVWYVYWTIYLVIGAVALFAMGPADEFYTLQGATMLVIGTVGVFYGLARSSLSIHDDFRRVLDNDWAKRPQAS